ncbi:MAG: hypothetical protein RL477_281, partial [Pseudomonadota bacterium]
RGGPPGGPGKTRVSAEQAMAMAEAAFDRGDRAAAAQICRMILGALPGYFFALNLLGIIEAEAGRAGEAAELFTRAAAANPRDASAHSNAGNALKALGRLDEALGAFDRAAALDARRPDIPNNRAAALLALGRSGEALVSADRALALAPDFADAHNNRAIALKDLGRTAEALAVFDRALALAPKFAEVHANRATLLRRTGRREDALAGFDAALALRPDLADALAGRGGVLLDLARAEEALAAFDRLATLRADDMNAHLGRALALVQLGRPDEALAAADRAAALAPDSAEAHNARGIALKEMDRLEEALAAYDRALVLKPDLAEAINNRGYIFQQWGELDRALACFERALALRPDYENARWNRTLCRLLASDFERGWDGFELRWENRPGGMRPPRLTREWTGAAGTGSLLVLKEQGIGDEIFYSGMLHDAAKRAGSLTACIEPRLLALYRRSFEGIRFVAPADIDAAGSFDAQIYMGDLCGHLRRTADDFAGVRRGYLVADPARAAGLRARLADGRLVCGLSWVSKSSKFGREKSLDLAALEPVLRLPGVRFVDLQYGDTSAERKRLREATGIELTSVPEIDNFKDIDGLAALIAACDVVLTVSNTTAHLAAALGKPVLLMVPTRPIWYWHLERNDSPWYPTVRLFRQDKEGDWSQVIAAVREALRAPQDFAKK